MAIGGRVDETGARLEGTTVFVVDPSSEVEAVALALRAAGHTVVEVSPSMLVARVAVQRPRIILVDADAEGALEVVERMRELPEADDIHVLFIARPGGAIASPEDALAHEASGLFVRPVDVRALVHKVQVLSGSALVTGESSILAAPSPCVPGFPPKGSTSAPSLPPASMRASMAPPASESKSFVPPASRPKWPSEPPLSSRGVATSGKVMGLAPPVSAELQRLLIEAERRVHIQVEHESIVPAPEDEIEAVLPADLLAALDEPLDEDDDDDDPVFPARSATSPAAARDRTSGRSAARGTRTPSTAAGSTNAGTPSPSPAARQSDTPPAPHTHGGTHSGPTGEGISTTGASDRRNRGDGRAAPEAASSSGGGAEARSTTGSALRKSLPPGRPSDAIPPLSLGRGDAMRAVARAIAGRTTGSLCVSGPEAERRIVLREGDLVTTSSTADDESLLAFLGVRGDLPRETVRRLGSKFPLYGRHAGAALVARGYVRQDQMWPTLRAHAEWLFARALQTSAGRLIVEPQPPGRLGGEPSVFGGSTGSSVFVEVIRRIVPPVEAVEWLGGLDARLAAGPEARLLAECALDANEVDRVRSASGRAIRDVLDDAPDGDLATVMFALSQLGVIEVQREAGARPSSTQEARPPDVSALDAEAVRERVRARLQLVDDGDYFALLGVARDATGYEVRRAFLELRRAFEPSRVLASEVNDLADDVRKIAVVLEEAYDILKDAARRERYRRAIEAAPDR